MLKQIVLEIDFNKFASMLEQITSKRNQFIVIQINQSQLSEWFEIIGGDRS